ncbi:hypothetical protein PPERSA_06172 [Pseudocohnilembus persalinus]|uniref:NAD-dependent epimerase/dehydratase domain-containing protein n=1 Tax=Pseudocohnilembus persalinus TaxID=266149 RepID=A0A0V0R133_PSEPJ|nr:hypothetical protein PPERSA_06172 [Pseudocohnilembus persalinus]|eukprot:KRX07994.1 hypothetical protein PPERSA_06172 [Pseudocohnilembus persalinus]
MKKKIVAVTGANGFIGLHIVNKFLNEGFKVVATVRDAQDEKKIKDLKNLDQQENLEIKSADLFDKQNFIEIFKNVNIIVHNASPLINSDKEDDFVKPALAGVENVFDAVLQIPKGQITNVIQISSNSAVGGDPVIIKDHTITENDWSDINVQREKKAWYALSKTLAEKKVLSYENKFKERGITLSRICPVYVLGPILQTDKINISTYKIYQLLTGDLKEIPQKHMNLVDVRDVAEMIYQAVIKNKPGRFVAIEKGYTLEEICKICRKYAGKYEKNIPIKVEDKEENLPAKYNVQSSYDLLGKQMIVTQLLFFFIINFKSIYIILI